MVERSDSDWRELAREGRRILKEVARADDLTTYGDFNRDLASETQLPPFDLTNDQGRNELSALLVNISELDWEDHRDYMLTSLVTLTGVKFPGKGFFTLAAQENFWDGIEPEREFWWRQVGLAHNAHPRGPAGRS
jgi:hypothetical protein